MNNINPLLLFVGKSGSGKSTVANYLSSNNHYIQLQSYTTRQPRYENEPGHIFIFPLPKSYTAPALPNRRISTADILIGISVIRKNAIIIIVRFMMFIHYF